MSLREAKAREMFSKGYNCAQSVLGAFCEEAGLDINTAINIAGGMGGGMRIGEICGAVSGAVMVIGIKHGFEMDTKWDLYKIVVEFMKQFEKCNGSTVCKKLLGYDFSIPEEQAAANNTGRIKEICPEMVASAVRILESMEFER